VPAALSFDDSDHKTVSAFLDHLEHDRGCSPPTRNARLAAIRSFYRYAALDHPEHAATIERVLAIPLKRTHRPWVTWLTKPELKALLAAPDQQTSTGRRDHAMILLAAQTGLRVSELTNVRVGDIAFCVGAHVQTVGKGRRERVTPLTATTVSTLRAWLKERGGMPADPLFPTRTGATLTRDALARRLTKYATIAAAACPSLAGKTITPHVLRHTAAMRLLRAKVDSSMIALWLGHAEIQTTQVYLHADLALKEEALAKAEPIHSEPGRYRPPDPLLAFLESL
jgi:site-specific recombinase XerD